MSECLVTGASGFLGRHLVQRLGERGHTVWCLSRQPPERPCAPYVRWIMAELHQVHRYEHVLARADQVFHLAAVLHSKRREEFHRVNALGTETLLGAYRTSAAPLKRFVLVSSIAAMGPSHSQRLLDETRRCTPESEYGKSKREGELAALRFRRSISVVILRPSFIYGEGDTRGVTYMRSVLNGSASLLSSVVATISLCHVSDVVQAVMCAADAPLQSGETFVISDGKTYGWEDVIRTIRAEMADVLSEGSFGRSRAMNLLLDRLEMARGGLPMSKRPQYWGCDTRKAEDQLGFQARTSLHTGAHRTLRWYLAQALMRSDSSVETKTGKTHP